MHKIALTGRIASGKSQISRQLAKRGWPVLDTDEVVDKLYHTSEIKDILQSKFGLDIFRRDGQVNRQRLAKLAWHNNDYRHALEQIFWPRVAQEVEMWLFGQTQKHSPLSLVSAALLYEANLDKMFDEIWLVVAPDDVILERLQVRDRLTPSDAQARLQAAPSDTSKIDRASVVITNGSKLQELESQVESLARWREKDYITN